MDKKQWLWEHKEFLCFFFVYLFILSFYVSQTGDIWWDAAVYDGMGKYIFSAGEVGLWEANRPLVWPSLLGFFWKIGVNELLAGKIMTLLFVLASVFLTYKIAYEIFGKKTALLGSVFLAFFPTFFLYASVLQTEIPSTFFFLLAFFLFLKNKYRVAGFLFGISVMTRFFQIFLIIPLVLYVLLLHLYIKKRLVKKDIAHLATSFSLPIIAYCILNFFLYGSPFYPFILQQYMTEHTGWVFHHPWFFYIVELWKEFFLCIFTLLSIFLIFKKDILQKRWSHAGLIAFIFLISFLPFIITPHKEMRILIPLFPFFCILAAYGLILLSAYSKNKKVQRIGIVLLIVVWLFLTIPRLQGNTYEDYLDPFYTFMSTTTAENIWISNPAFIVYTDKKAEELLYFPLYNTEKIKTLQEKKEQAEIIAINSCDLLPCHPTDETCEEMHDDFIEELKASFTIVLQEQQRGCMYYIFERMNTINT